MDLNNHLNHIANGVSEIEEIEVEINAPKAIALFAESEVCLSV